MKQLLYTLLTISRNKKGNCVHTLWNMRSSCWSGISYYRMTCYLRFYMTIFDTPTFELARSALDRNYTQKIVHFRKTKKRVLRSPWSLHDTTKYTEYKKAYLQIHAMNDGDEWWICLKFYLHIIRLEIYIRRLMIFLN